MRYVGIILILCSFPIFLSILRSGAGAQRWAFLALGALPVVGIALNIDAAFVSWATWPGHTKGIIVSLTDTLALAICVKLHDRSDSPQLLWVWILFFLLNKSRCLLFCLLHCNLSRRSVGILVRPLYCSHCKQRHNDFELFTGRGTAIRVSWPSKLCRYGE